MNISVNAGPDDPTSKILEKIAERNVKDAVVKVTYTVPEGRESSADLGKVREALSDAFLVAGIVRRLEIPERRLRARISEETAVVDALDRYVEANPRLKDLAEDLRHYLTTAQPSKTPEIPRIAVSEAETGSAGSASTPAVAEPARPFSDREPVRVVPKGLRSFDAEDADFWEGMQTTRYKLVMFTMPSLSEMLDAVQQLRRAGYTGKVASVAKYEDEREAMKAAGADVVFNYYAEAGAGFAEHTLSNLLELLPEKPAPVEPAQA